MEQKSGSFKEPTKPVDVTESKMKGLKKFFSSFIRKPSKKHLMIVGGISAGVLTLGVAGLALFGPKAAEPDPVPEVTSNYVEPEPTTTASPLTGVQVSPDLAARPVTAVMIENSVDARPQAALIDAGVVFEAIAEGGITRFLAVFQETKPDYIGPIRSARPYYVRWAAGYDAAYAHSGGSGEALALIQALGIKDMDHGRYGSQYFDRVSNRYAPHNVYTSMSRLDDLKNANGYTKSTYTPQDRLQDDPKTKGTDESLQIGGAPATTINFTISGPLYNTAYSYDATTHTYKRNLAGTPHLDEKSGKQITPSVVVALYMNYRIHSDGVHSVYDNIGSGKALVFQNGVALEAVWEKPTDSSSLIIKNIDGSPFLMAVGQTWFTAIQEGRVSYSP